MASGYVPVLDAGRRGLAAVFSPRKHPMVLLAALLGARRRSCLARSISNAYQVATKRRGVVRATWRAHRNEFSPVLTKIQDSARTATLAMAALAASTPHTCSAKHPAPDNEMTDKFLSLAAPKVFAGTRWVQM